MEDLAKIVPLDPRTNPALAEHIASARLIREQLGGLALVQTVFSPLSILLQLASLPSYPGGDFAGSTATLTREELLRSDPALAHAALSAITQTFSDYLALLMAPVEDGGAGLDGVFYAVTGTASSDYVDKETFDEYSRPYDLQVLAAVGDGAVVFHTCRADSHPGWFTDYPIDALQWDQFQNGNPALDTDFGVTVVGGVFNELFAVGGDRALTAQLETTLANAPERPFLLAPAAPSRPLPTRTRSAGCGTPREPVRTNHQHNEGETHEAHHHATARCSRPRSQPHAGSGGLLHCLRCGRFLRQDTCTSASRRITGQYAQYGEQFKKAFDLAAEEVNAAGGINGHPVALKYGTQSDPKQSVAVAQKFVGDSTVALVFGDYSRPPRSRRPRCTRPASSCSTDSTTRTRPSRRRARTTSGRPRSRRTRPTPGSPTTSPRRASSPSA